VSDTAEQIKPWYFAQKVLQRSLGGAPAEPNTSSIFNVAKLTV